MSAFETDLERRLRSLSEPEVPAGLEAKLIAAIGVPRSRGQWRWMIAVAGGALAASIALVVVLKPTAAPQSSPVNKSVSPAYILNSTEISRARETRPCDIFPPFPQSS